MSFRRKQVALAVGGALLAIGSAHAAPTVDELQKQLDELQATVHALQKQIRESVPEGASIATTADVDGVRAQLEDTKYNSARDREYKTALSSRGLTIGGTLTTSYVHSSEPTAATSNSPQGKGARNTFGVGASLSFAGNLYKDYAEGRNLDYKLGLAYSTPKLANGSSTNTPAQGDSVSRLTDVYIQYKLLPDTGSLEEPKLTVALGQQKIPFGLEAQVSDELRPTVSTAQFLGGLANLNSRQIGVVLKGDIDPTADYGFNYRAPLIEYAFAVINGNGANTTDDNNRKDYVARLTATTPADYYSWWRQLTLGASWYNGKKNLNSTATPYALFHDDARTLRRGVDLTYNHNPYGATYEYVAGFDDALVTPASTTSGTIKQVRSQGRVLTLFYNFGDIAQWSKNLNNVGKFDDSWPTTSQVYVRYDTWDPNREVALDKVVKNTVGYNLFFAQTTKLQVGVTKTRYEAGSPKLNDTTLTAQFQYGF